MMHPKALLCEQFTLYLTHYFGVYMIRIHCKKASHLIVQSRYQALTVKERARLRLHLGFCHYCRAFKRQMNAIEQSVEQWKDGSESPKK